MATNKRKARAGDTWVTNDAGEVIGVIPDGLSKMTPIGNVLATVDKLTGKSVLLAAGIEFSGDMLIDPNKSIIVVGGDHPYKDWWGTNGNDGMAQMFLDQKIRPYIAICADDSPDKTSGTGSTLGRTGMLSVEQARALESKGVEFVNHAARHPHFWELINTGIRVYYTGLDAAPTVAISATQLTLNTTPSGAAAIPLAGLTLNALKAAIEAVAGWKCLLAVELLGTESAALLMPISAARSVANGSDVVTYSNQRFALSGGVMLRYTGLAYRDVTISLNDGSNFLSLFLDGARVIAASTAVTLTSLVNTINALNISGLTALVMDNGYNAQTVAGSSELNPGQKLRETYCYGDELAQYLHKVPQAQSINSRGLMCSGGVGHTYAIRRLVLAVKEKNVSTYGLRLESFAKSGGRFWPWLVRNIADEHVGWRVDTGFTDIYSQLSPFARPANHAGKYVGTVTSLVSYTEGDVKAIAAAAADGNGWIVNWLNHLCTPDGQSPYKGLGQQSGGDYASGADQPEGAFYRELQYAASLRDAGLIEILSPTAAERSRELKKGPTNLVFNPKFRNGRADNIGGITGNAQGSGGVAMPGWFVGTASADFSEASIGADRALTLTTAGALGSSRTPIGCNLLLEPGKTYDIGAFADLSAWGAANSLRMYLNANQNGMGEDFILGAGGVTTQGFFGPFIGDAGFTFTVPPRGGPNPARCVGIVGPFSFSAGDAITVSMDNRGVSAAIVLTGLTTAKAVAAAINAQMVADAAYSSLAQYHTIAVAEDNRVIISAPKVNIAPNDSGSMLILANSVGTPLATLFGAGVSTVRSVSKSLDAIDSTMTGYRLSFVPSTTAGTQTMKISDPYCREVKF